MTNKMLVEIKTRRMWEKFPINFQVKKKNFRISSLPDILHEDENSKANSSANSRDKIVSDSRRFSTPRGSVHVAPEDHVISDFLNQAFVSSSRGLVEESRNLVASPSLGGSERISVELARPNFDLARPSIDLARPNVDLARPSIDLALPSIELARPNLDVARPNVDLARPSIDLARPSIDLVRPSIDLGRPSMELDRPSTDLARPVASANARPVAGARAKVDAPSAGLPKNAVNVDVPVAEVYKRLGKVLPGYRRIVGGLEADVEIKEAGKVQVKAFVRVVITSQGKGRSLVTVTRRHGAAKPVEAVFLKIARTLVH
jgi:ribosomal protein L19